MLFHFMFHRFLLVVAFWLKTFKILFIAINISSKKRFFFYYQILIDRGFDGIFLVFRAVDCRNWVLQLNECKLLPFFVVILQLNAFFERQKYIWGPHMTKNHKFSSRHFYERPQIMFTPVLLHKSLKIFNKIVSLILKKFWLNNSILPFSIDKI